MARNVIPIKTNTKFFSKEDYDFEVSLILEYLENDVQQSVVLYEVDLEKTNMNAVYKETQNGGIRFKTPKELTCLYEIEEAETRTFDKKTNTGIYSINGKLKIEVLQYTLDEQKCEIKRGDYIGVVVEPTKMVYFTVVDDGKVNHDNRHLLLGMKPVWRSIVCAPVDKNEFDG